MSREFFVLAFASLFILASCTSGEKSSSEESTWERMPGYAKQVSTKGDELWAINQFDQAVRWYKGGWKYVHIMVKMIAAAADGYTHAIVEGAMDYAKSNHWRFDPNKGHFDYMNHWGISTITALGVNSAYCVHWGGCVGKWTGAWAENPFNGPGDCPAHTTMERAAAQLAMGDSNELWKLDTNGTLHRLVNNAWQKVDHPPDPKHIDVQSPNRVVMTDMDNVLWFWNAHYWKKVKGQDCMQASVNYKYVYCVSPDHRIWRVEV